MRKIILTAVAIMFLTGGIAFADYKDKTHETVVKQLEAFYAAEQGNTLTPYSWITLKNIINKTFMDNVVVPKTKDKKKD